MSRICVVIPMYGQAEYTRKCIELTKKNAGIYVDILVVDDGSPEPFKEPGVEVLRLAENSGFTNAVNQGMLWASKVYNALEEYHVYEYVLLLNNDTEPYPNFIKNLCDVMDNDKSIAIASSVRLHPKDGSYEAELYGVDLLRGFQAVTKLENLKDEVIECNWVPTCSSLIRMDVIREIGLFDKHMRTHSSDLDYCLRVKMADYKVVVVTSSRVIHHHEVTTKTNGISPERDQKVLLEKLSGINYAALMKKIPLDAESNLHGQLQFTVYRK